MLSCGTMPSLYVTVCYSMLQYVTVSAASPYAPIFPPVLSSVPSRLEVQYSTETSSIECPRATHRVRVATCRVWLAMRCTDVRTVTDGMQGHRRWSGRKMKEMKKRMMNGVTGGEVNGAFVLSDVQNGV